MKNKISCKSFLNLPIGDIEVDFEGISKFNYLMETIQWCFLAIEDEIKKNCGYSNWFKPGKHEKSELFKILKKVENYLRNTIASQSNNKHTCISDKKCFDFSKSLCLTWRLGTSLLALDANGDRVRESKRLITKEFYKSEYVLYVARLFALAGYNVRFEKENVERTPDLIVEGEVEVECKKQDPSSNLSIRNSFKKARRQISEGGLGIICIDMPAKFDLKDHNNIKKLTRELRGEFNSTNRVHFCFISQVKSTETGRGDSKEFQLQISKCAFPNPFKLAKKFPDKINIEKVFGKVFKWK